MAATKPLDSSGSRANFPRLFFRSEFPLCPPLFSVFSVVKVLILILILILLLVLLFSASPRLRGDILVLAVVYVLVSAFAAPQKPSMPSRNFSRSSGVIFSQRSCIRRRQCLRPPPRP